jgi:hypothetical protein
MARGEHRLSALARLVAAAAMLLAACVIMAAIGTTEPDSGSTVKVGGSFPRDFVPIELMAPHVKHDQLRPTGPTGDFTSPCGTNGERNTSGAGIDANADAADSDGNVGEILRLTNHADFISLMPTAVAAEGA